jgi:DASH complex subunit DAD3
VLWEYAKLAQNVRIVTQKTRLLSEEPDKVMLAKLRILEKKMGLVLTLFKASVWGVINEQPEQQPAMQSTDYSDPNDTTIVR